MAEARTVKTMTVEELREELREAEEALEDVREERRFTLAQTGVHIGARELKTMLHRWERDESRLLERLDEIKARLEG